MYIPQNNGCIIGNRAKWEVIQLFEYDGKTVVDNSVVAKTP